MGFDKYIVSFIYHSCTIYNDSTTLKILLCNCFVIRYSPSPRPWQPLIQFSIFVVLLFPQCHMNEIMLQVALESGLFLLAAPEK